MATKHFAFKVTGKVQGVFFRKSTKEKANQFELNGTVKNLDDGSVEVHAEGAEENLKKLEQWLRDGPPQARVEHVSREEKSLRNFEGFEVIR